MNPAHIHLMITHLPIFASLLGSIVLLYGLSTGSKPTIDASYLLFIVAAIGGTVAYLTGEGAEETVESLQGIVKSAIESHEDSAKFTLISIGILGVFSAISLLRNYRKGDFVRPVAMFMLVLSLISFGISAYTGWLGGKIRHTEFSNQIQTDIGKSHDAD